MPMSSASALRGQGREGIHPAPTHSWGLGVSPPFSPGPVVPFQDAGSKWTKLSSKPLLGGPWVCTLYPFCVFLSQIKLN